jgi:alpha-D-xyloside xylohydrolase
MFVRAGSIVAMGPLMQHTAEKPADPIELRVYTGADAQFTLFEDDGLTLEYQTSAFGMMTIDFSYVESTKTLTIGKRNGSYPGMLASRTFEVVWVAPGHGAGLPSTPHPDIIFYYDGQEVSATKPEPPV